MANTTSPLFAQPQKEARINPKNIIGSTFEDIFENITGRNQSYTNEGPIRGIDLENLQKMPEHKVGSSFPTTGELKGFNIPSEESQKKRLAAELSAAHNQAISQTPVESKRENINRLNGLQESYRGSVDNEGNVTDYHRANAEQKEARNLVLQIQAERGQKLAAAKGTGSKRFAMGEHELDKGGENFGHFTRATG